MSKLTVTIPDDLHQQIRDELERQGIRNNFWGWRLTDLCVISEQILRLTTRKNVCYTFHRAQEREWTTAEWQRKSSDWWMLAMVMRWCCSQRTARWRKSAR